MFKIVMVVMVAGGHTYVKMHQIVPFKYVQFIVDQYLNRCFKKDNPVPRVTQLVSGRARFKRMSAFGSRVLNP